MEKKKQLYITLSGLNNNGKTRVTYLLKKFLRSEGFDIDFEPNFEYETEESFNKAAERNFDASIKNIKECSKIIINEVTNPYIGINDLIEKSDLCIIDGTVFKDNETNFCSLIDNTDFESKYELISYNEDSKILKLKTK